MEVVVRFSRDPFCNIPYFLYRSVQVAPDAPSAWPPFIIETLRYSSPTAYFERFSPQTAASKSPVVYSARWLNALVKARTVSLIEIVLRIVHILDDPRNDVPGYCDPRVVYYIHSTSSRVHNLSIDRLRFRGNKNFGKYEKSSVDGIVFYAVFFFKIKRFPRFLLRAAFIEFYGVIKIPRPGDVVFIKRENGNN